MQGVPDDGQVQRKQQAEQRGFCGVSQVRGASSQDENALAGFTAGRG
jgi:hypothetical protein